jgi:hypothetical protein
MGMTIVEKILAKHAGVGKVVPGQLIEAKVDLILANDITAPIAIKQFREAGAKKVFDSEREQGQRKFLTANVLFWCPTILPQIRILLLPGSARFSGNLHKSRTLSIILKLVKWALNMRSCRRTG